MSTENKPTTSDQQPADNDKARAESEAARLPANLKDAYNQRTIADGAKTFRRGY